MTTICSTSSVRLIAIANVLSSSSNPTVVGRAAPAGPAAASSGTSTSHAYVYLN